MTQYRDLQETLDKTFSVMDQVLDEQSPELEVQEIGDVVYVGPGIVRVRGLRSVQSEEVLQFRGNLQGMAFNVDMNEIGVVMLDETEGLRAGTEVWRTGRVVDTPVGESLIGRVMDARARPLDNAGPISGTERRPVERKARGIMDRLPVTVPLQTGLKVVDALLPIGRGQRELILGDRQTGKTAITVDAIINQHDKDVICIYCGIGKRSSTVAKLIAELEERGAMDYSIVMLATEDDPPGLQFIAPYAATSMGEYFMEQGKDVLIIYDDLTRHARAYRELSLLLRRPPGREAFPGDIFYIHSRLLERSTHLKEDLGGGSLTALPIVETQAQNLSAYIPTNLISITDGQIYLSPQLFQKGILPAVDVGTSVSRVGGKTQLPAYRRVAGDLRLSYSQFQELESFARFGTRMDEETRKTLERGRRVREILKQPQYEPMPVAEQIAVLVAVNEGLFDDVPTGQVMDAAREVRKAVTKHHPDICEKIESGDKLSDSDIDQMTNTARSAIQKTADTGEEKERGDRRAEEEKAEREKKEKAREEGGKTEKKRKKDQKKKETSEKKNR